jgi:hypothetical protein
MEPWPSRTAAARVCELLALAIVLAQAGGIVRMFFVEDRFFCWSPHDSRVDFTVTATHRGRAVSQNAIKRRYKLHRVDWHAAGNVFKVIETAEGRRPEGRRWSVRTVYRVNLGPEEVWEYRPVNP